LDKIERRTIMTPSDERAQPLVAVDNVCAWPNLTLMGDGTIRSENGVLGRLRVVRFDNPQQLRAEGDRVFEANGAEAQPVDRPALRQGVLEGSNVRPVLEMTRLTAELREFQFAAQFAEKEGERLSTAVERILRRRS
jgi:flagellar basal-body rod protein FlgF